MSALRYGWWGYAKHMVRRWPDRLNENEYAAVAAALAETERYRNADARLKVVQTVLMEGAGTLEYAAAKVPCSTRQAQRYHSDFLRAVGRNFRCEGLLEDKKGPPCVKGAAERM